ncbi:MAG: OB-fold domain-containing protein [Chelatococcus sp.]|uniref:Zn-ribbon domain-containing OB-fold protein n=1 Tax=Chelatococcus sp. TaxID=1953771 RepID=UPI0025BABF86|nr:OB-fold domain-containing protein [Chelatococcus sp.]MBX3539409.1 OB-fold domain-containing protein [Chelatococcus sp.]
MMEVFGAAPLPTPETEHFWAGTREGRLLLQKCTSCYHVYFPPRPFCPACASRAVNVFRASGKARLYSYSIDYVNGRDGLPVAVAVVELDEGVKMMSNLRDVAPTPEALILDMKLEVVFERLDDTITIPQFRPAREGAI